MVVYLLLVLVALTICQGYVIGAAAPPPSPPSPVSTPTPAAQANEFLQAHNKARKEVGVKPLNWSETIAKEASLLLRYQRNKVGCKFVNVTGDKYGVNQLWASGKETTPGMAVETWVEEKKYYNHTSNTCALNHDKCGVYTQVVWNKTMTLGCAQVVCVKDNQASLTLCYYSPPGNYVGESPY